MRERTTAAGFSLVELLVSLLLVALVLGGAMTMFNYTNKLSRAQLHQSDLQQSGRVAQRDLLRNLRMAGRGGLVGFHVPGTDPNSGPASITPAIEVRNNTPSGNQRLAVGDNSSPLVVEDTDVLTVRGHFNSPPLFVNSTDPTTFTFDSGTGAGAIVVSSHVNGDVMQDMTAIVEAVNANRTDAILLVSNLSDEIYGVAELNPGGSNVPDPYVPDPNNEITITIAFTTGGTYGADYSLLSADGVFPDGDPLNHPNWLPPRALSGVGMIALLEEYRYYIRDPEDGTAPRLSRARFFPGTEVDHPVDGFENDIADNIYDLQVALGFDSSFDGSNTTNGFFAFDPDNTGADDIIFDADVEPTGDTATDDWLFNAAGDTTALGSLPWTPQPAAGGNPPIFSASQPRPRLYYARVTSLAMAARPDSGYAAPVITAIEDHAYPGDSADPVNNIEGRARRRLLLTTIADLRNL